MSSMLVRAGIKAAQLIHEEEQVKFWPLFLLFLSSAILAQQYTRGIGVYPGDPSQYDGPRLAVDAVAYRNLALHRPAYQSSAYDYNLTAQLVTDGIRGTELPRWIEVSTSDRGLLDKQQRELFFDGNPASSISVEGPSGWVEFDIEGGGQPPEVDHMELAIRKMDGQGPATGWRAVVTGSNDRRDWKEVGRYAEITFPSVPETEPSFVVPVELPAPVRYRSYRVAFSGQGVKAWGLAEVKLLDQGQEVHVAGPELFTSAWMSAGTGEEWISVDLGAECTFDHVKLYWIRRPAEGSLQASNDGDHWRNIEALAGKSDDIQLREPEHARWVRLLMIRPGEPGERYILSELEVYGRGGPLPVPQPARDEFANGSLNLKAGNWRLQRGTLVPESGEQIATPGFVDSEWMIATVPGTVLTSYLNDGAIPDPGFGENQYVISDSFFTADFWYRRDFTGPLVRTGQHLWLDFAGINWKARVYLNGKYLGQINGGFEGGRFEVTQLLRAGAMNALAVLVLRNQHPGGTKDKAGPTVNGGALGRDNPTYHASAGWDWMPTIRGRNSGIWGDVTLVQTGEVTIEDPLVTSVLPLPSTASADVRIAATLRNHETHAVFGTLRVTFGTINVEQTISLSPLEAKTVEFTPAAYDALHIPNPKLWWPVGYGDPNLYAVTISFETNSRVSDKRSFNAGIRQFSYSEDGGVLKIWINGRRFIARGGNWGFPESMLRFRAREYDAVMRYHRDQHFNMVRNWVGQTGDEAFYDAADRFGVVVWQDFWLANPWDGPNPDNNEFFLTVARDYLLRIRQHPSIGLFCGRNEGFPPKPIDNGLSAMVAELAPGSHYISSSADGPVSGHGPYRVEPLRFYFEHSPQKLHSEIGAPNVPEMEIMRKTLSDHGMWPIGPEWRLHDFYGDNPFVDAVDRSYGGAANAEEFMSLAQFVDYNTYRGMFEGQSRNRLGVLIWMSHPAWPSILWQTYDYFFDTDAAYYAAKKAAEPLHIQWDAADDNVEVVNYSAGLQTGLTAQAEVLDIDGSVKWQKSASIDSDEDSTLAPIHLEFPPSLAPTHFIRLMLLRNGNVLSRNFYMHATTEEDYRGIRSLGVAHVAVRTRVKRNGSRWILDTSIRNKSGTPALMVRIKAVREQTGDLIAPALYDDNYIALMPEEIRTIHIELEDADTRGERPRVVVKGYNLASELKAK